MQDFLAQIEKEGYVVGEVPKVNNALDEMDSNGIVVSSEHNQALHFLLQPKLYILSTMNTCQKLIRKYILSDQRAHQVKT